MMSWSIWISLSRGISSSEASIQPFQPFRDAADRFLTSLGCEETVDFSASGCDVARSPYLRIRRFLGGRPGRRIGSETLSLKRGEVGEYGVDDDLRPMVSS